MKVKLLMATDTSVWLSHGHSRSLLDRKEGEPPMSGSEGTRGISA